MTTQAQSPTRKHLNRILYLPPKSPKKPEAPRLTGSERPINHLVSPVNQESTSATALFFSFRFLSLSPPTPPSRGQPQLTALFLPQISGTATHGYNVCAWGETMALFRALKSKVWEKEELSMYRSREKDREPNVLLYVHTQNKPKCRGRRSGEGGMGYGL